MHYKHMFQIVSGLTSVCLRYIATHFVTNQQTVESYKNGSVFTVSPCELIFLRICMLDNQ